MSTSPRWYTGLSRYQWTVLLIAWLGWVFDVMDAALFNFAKVPMLTEMLGGEEGFKAHGLEVGGNIQSLFFLGQAVGGLAFGILADRWGRTRTLVVTILFYCAFTGLTALCHTPEQVAVVRFLAAMGIGGEWAAGVALVAEAFPDRARAPAASVLQSAAAFGPALAALANLALAGQNWRWLFVIGVLPALLCVAIRAMVREQRPVSSVREGPAPFPLAELLRNPLWRRHALVAAIVGTVGVAGAGTATYWQPDLVKAASEGLPKAVVDARTSYLALVSHIGTLLGVIAVPALCERFGRRRTIAAFFVGSPLTVLLAVTGGATYERLLLVMPLFLFFAVGVSAAFVLYFPELFPGRVRATGAGLAYNVGRTLAIPMPVITASLAGVSGGSVASAIVLSGCIYVFGLIALTFAPETRGKPLPED